MDKIRLKINYRRDVKAVQCDVKDNLRLKINHRWYVKAVETNIKDNDRLKKITDAMCKLWRPILRIMIG